MSAQEEDQTSAEGTETQQTAKGIRGLSASEFEPIESENGNIVILYTNDVHCAVETGISFDLDLDKNTQVQVDNNGLFEGFGSEERRVSNIKVNGEPLDPDREYTLGGTLFLLQQQGSGITFFDGAETVDIGRNILDIDAVAEYLGSMGGTVSEEYADPYGQERIHFISE